MTLYIFDDSFMAETIDLMKQCGITALTYGLVLVMVASKSEKSLGKIKARKAYWKRNLFPQYLVTRCSERVKKRS